MNRSGLFRYAAQCLSGFLMISGCFGRWGDGSENNSTSIPPQTIVGGSPVDVDQYPWFVQGNGCGGSLVAPDIVLTAAHCLNFFPVGGQVHIGNRQRDCGLEGTVESSIVHPSYGQPLFHHDLMLVKLQQSVDKTPVKLNLNPKYPRIVTTLTAVGFGQIGWENVTSHLLLDVALHGYRNCGAIYGRNLDERFILCAGSHDVQGTCLGDSGGPLVATNGRLVGVTSFGPGRCGMPDVPSGFSRVSSHIPWLKKNICDMSRKRPVYLCGKNRKSHLRGK